MIAFKISNIIKLDKSDGTNRIPTKILKLLNKNISVQLALLFNQSFASGIFLSIMKTSNYTNI